MPAATTPAPTIHFAYRRAASRRSVFLSICLSIMRLNFFLSQNKHNKKVFATVFDYQRVTASKLSVFGQRHAGRGN
jgi:hypothetical protein